MRNDVGHLKSSSGLHTCTHAPMRAHRCTHTYERTHVYTHARAHTHAPHTLAHVHSHTCTRAHTHVHTQPHIYKYVFNTTHVFTVSLSLSPTHRFKLNSEEDWVYGVQSLYNFAVSLFKEKCSKFYIESQLGHKRSGMQSSLKLQ